MVAFAACVCAALVLLGVSLGQDEVAATGRFVDVPPDNSYAPAITDLADRAIVNGFTDDTFRPKALVMRQQFVKMLTLTLGFAATEADACPFGDVSIGGPDTLYPDNYVAVGASRGVVLGTAPGLFSPYDNLTRAQMISMVVRAIDSLADGPLPAARGTSSSTWGQSDPQHGANVQWAEAEGLLVGLPLEELDPNGPASRGEVAQILHNVEHDVRYYGARGDGVTDDWKALDAGMQAAAAAGTPLYLPAGTYLTSGEFSPPNGVTIMGDGPDSVIYMPDNGELRFIFHRADPEHVTIRDLTLRGDGYTGNSSGLYLYGARDCTLRNLVFEECWYGMKLGDAHRQAQRWTVEDISAVRCRMPMYIHDVEDSSFDRMTLEGMNVDDGQDHCIYMSKGCYRLTFTDVTLVGGGGFGLHLYSGGGGTTSDIVFTNLTIHAARQPMAIADGFSDIRFYNLKSVMNIDEVHLRVSGCTDIVFDGFSASGGYAFLGTWEGDRAGTITVKNGIYDRPVVDDEEKGIANLIVENVTSGSTTTTEAGVTSTSEGPQAP